jgi:hypothetical protein
LQLRHKVCLVKKARLRVRVFVIQVFTISKTNALEEGIIINKHTVAIRNQVQTITSNLIKTVNNCCNFSVYFHTLWWMRHIEVKIVSKGFNSWKGTPSKSLSRYFLISCKAKERFLFIYVFQLSTMPKYYALSSFKIKIKS